jgi:UDP-N-acetylmuramoyl-L-alanyl-D-glutamate--2,6-diaminopimelate ligase
MHRARIKNYMVEPDRAKAIRMAIMNSKAGDVVLIAGKGHENYQILGQTKIHFDDREEALKVLNEYS